MKKTLKATMLVILSLIMCLASMPICATESENQITPRLSHMADASFSFDATSSVGYIDATYTGYSASFVSAKLTVTVEKRFLWAFWNDVGTWTATSTELLGSFYHEMSLNGSGTYRATFVLEVTGADGTVDVVDMVIESKT
ncbi:MAG: hypothetical protein J6S23_02260 [Clostridia bacterium]|nr:hypothetical protein [Clostridia bacterium]